MTAEQLVKQLEEHWEKDMKPRQRQAYLRKIRRFSADELDQIFEKLLEEYTYLPRISQIYKQAFEVLQIDTRTGPSKSVCGTCFGSGVRRGEDQFYERCHCICTLCDGTGWQEAPPDMNRIRSVYGDKATAESIQGTVRHCGCRSSEGQRGEMSTPADRIPF